jgi:hypothetical protein
MALSLKIKLYQMTRRTFFIWKSLITSMNLIDADTEMLNNYEKLILKKLASKGQVKLIDNATNRFYVFLGEER